MKGKINSNLMDVCNADKMDFSFGKSPLDGIRPIFRKPKRLTRPRLSENVIHEGTLGDSLGFAFIFN